MNKYTFEYSPCKLEEPSDLTKVISCDESEAEFWGIYMRINDLKAEWLIDVETKGEAIKMATVLTRVEKLINDRKN